VSTQDPTLQLRAESGDPDAQMNLAVIHDNSGMHEQALDWLRKAAESGHAPAQHVLGARLLVGRAAPFDPIEGTRWVETAADQGLPQALALKAVLVTLASDWTSAVNLMKEAAARGHDHAREQIALLGDPTRFDAGLWDQPPVPQWRSESPPVAVYERFIPPAFCEWIIRRARPKLQAARVKDPEHGGARQVDYRSNSGAGISLIDSDLLLQMVNARIADAIQAPMAYHEPTNILHYKTGEEYRRHFDFITPSEKHAAELKVSGQRIATFLIYLNDDFEGGETEFPELNFRFKGRTGDALAFWNLTAEGEPDKRTLHAGLPPTRGEKWLFSKWIRARPYPLI
jgi:predicted 2-oxoglutarate/Fe(II)-dependent dioxygenase YbiX